MVPDNTDYIVQLLVTNVHTLGGILTKRITGGNLKIKVVDSMYNDDVIQEDDNHALCAIFIVWVAITDFESGSSPIGHGL